MRYILCAVLGVSSFFNAQTVHAQSEVQRPRLLGVAHVAFRVSDISKTAAFYKNVLGYQEPFSLKEDAGKSAIAFIKVNDLQYVELFPGDSRSRGQLDHFALYTDDLAAMRAYLQAQGTRIVEDIHVGRVGNSFLTVRDPDGHPIEILQYSGQSMTARSQAKFIPAGRVSTHITHVGILISSVGSSMKFYRDILGFREFSRGAGNNGQPGWVDLVTPDGSDYLELIPFSGVPTAAELRAQNHFGLLSSNAQKTVAALQARASGSLLSSPIVLQTGGNLPPRTNLFDPDGGRVEIMESVSPAAAATKVSYP